MSFSEWREAKLGDLCTVKGGKRLPKGRNLTTNITKHPYIRIRDMYQHKYIEENGELEYVDEQTFELIKRYIVDSGDIILAIVGNTIGLVSLIGKSLNKASLTENCVKLIDMNSVKPEFIYYYLITEAGQNEIKSKIVGTSQPKLPIYGVQDIKIPVPPLNEQDEIVATLASLDDKIKVNNQINKTLEDMAQAIFKQWFVDFEFPNEDGEPYKSSGGEMVESELGMIPKGWEVSQIGDECICLLGGTPSRQNTDYWNGDIPWINSGEVNNFRIYTPTEYITKLGFEKSATKLLKKKTTVLAITGATLGQVSLLEIDTCANQSVVGICENNKISYVYIYPYIKSIIKKIIGSQTGGAQQHINKGNVEDTKILIPNKEILNDYIKLVRPQYDLIASICFENEVLTNIRDTLLPKLMSGEIRVPLDEECDAS